MKIKEFLSQNHAHMHIYITGAKHALNYRGFDDYMVYYTLLAMGIPREHIDYIGKDERNKRENKMKLKEIPE